MLGTDAPAAQGFLAIGARAWLTGAHDVLAFDDTIDARAARGAFVVVVYGDADARAAAGAQVKVRCARWEGLRNDASTDSRFVAALRRHRRIHDLEKPLVRADYRHALDVWQWVLRLEPEAAAPLQLAALLHDVERLATESDRRDEPWIDDYDAHKARHAEASARIASQIVESLSWEPPVCARVADLVAGHDRAGGRSDAAASVLADTVLADTEASVLADADALSFLALNAAGYLAWHGHDQAVRKTQWTLGRLSDRGRDVLSRLALTAPIEQLVRRARHPIAGARREAS